MQSLYWTHHVCVCVCAAAFQWESLIVDTIAQIFTIGCLVSCRRSSYWIFNNRIWVFSPKCGAGGDWIGIVASLGTEHANANPFVIWVGVVSRRAIQIEQIRFDFRCWTRNMVCSHMYKSRYALQFESGAIREIDFHLSFYIVDLIHSIFRLLNI